MNADKRRYNILKKRQKLKELFICVYLRSSVDQIAFARVTVTVTISTPQLHESTAVTSYLYRRLL